MRLPLATLTHARIRARQGDVVGARQIVEQILDRDPDDAEARTLLVELSRRDAAPCVVEESDPPLADPQPADSISIAGRFRRALGRGRSSRERIRRLEAWLARVAAGED